MKIFVDSREQRPLELPACETVTMPYGDYGAEWDGGGGMPVVFERKSIPDLWGTLSTTDGHERFKREMERAKADGVKLILIIEGSIAEVGNGFSRSQFPGKSMVKKLFTMWVKYDLSVVFCQNRGEMRRYIMETFEAIERNWSPKMSDRPLRAEVVCREEQKQGGENAVNKAQ